MVDTDVTEMYEMRKNTEDGLHTSDGIDTNDSSISIENYVYFDGDIVQGSGQSDDQYWYKW